MNDKIDLNSICSEIQRSSLSATKCANDLPSLEFAFYNNFDKFVQIMKHQSNTSLNMLSSLIANECKGKKIETIADDEDKFEMLCDINDNMLDVIGNHLDEASGLKRKDAELVMATIKTESDISNNTPIWNRKIIRGRRLVSYNLLSAKVVERPQFKFKDKIDNSNSPFIPIIKDKPNSIKPLSIMPEINEEGLETYSHPYEVEIEKFKPSDCFLQINKYEMPKPVEECSFKYVSTKDELYILIEDLKNSKEIAVDLEHHSYRTFQGFTCLIQISTRKTDYIIDALELRSELYLLNEVFTSPSILKVFHGSEMDVIWLQRDFGVYIVNMFDTAHAARLLNFPHLSLSFLLKHYCNLEADKKFQLADWRIRPLTEDMLRYAREDTHYLLFIYEKMKSELFDKGNIDKNLVKAVFERSKSSCLRKYEKPLLNSDSYTVLLKKSNAAFNSRQKFALKELYSWRDKLSRIEDESIGYVLPNHMLMNIAEVLPKEQQGVLACCNPIPPLVKQQLNEIHLIILKARESPLVRKTDENPKDIFNMSFSYRVVDIDDAFEMRHDINHLDRDHNVKTLLDDFNDNTHDEHNRISSSISSSFIKLYSKKAKKLKSQHLIEKIKSNFISPYQRYSFKN